MITIVMPTHRKPPLLHLTLLSVLSQNYDDYELVVVDASDDTYFKDEFDNLMSNHHLLSPHIDKKGKVRVVRPDDGHFFPGRMKMYGFRNAIQDNDFCLFLDHDDFLWGGTLMNIHNADLAYPNKDMVGMDYTSMVYLDGKVYTNTATYMDGKVCGTTDSIWIDRFYFKFDGNQDIYRCKHLYKSPMCPKIISKKALREKRMLFVEDTGTMDDIAFYMLSHSLSEVYVNAVGYVYVAYRNTTSTSGRDVSDTVNRIAAVSNSYSKILSEIGYVKHRDVYVP